LYNKKGENHMKNNTIISKIIFAIALICVTNQMYSVTQINLINATNQSSYIGGWNLKVKYFAPNVNPNYAGLPLNVGNGQFLGTLNTLDNIKNISVKREGLLSASLSKWIPLDVPFLKARTKELLATPAASGYEKDIEWVITEWSENLGRWMVKAQAIARKK
jgi:hypothetical protein